jgi:nickel/cobalt transporter (NicO) family protein
MRRLASFLLPVLLLTVPARAHEIPNARVDRSIQATVRPGSLAIAYEVSLSELSLTQDLRALIGTLPGGDRQEWFDRYGAEVGPLNAKGVLVTVDGESLPLHARGFDLAVEDHPRYTFHFEAPLPPRGRLVIQDTNYASSEGTSRLAVQRQGGVEIAGDNLSADVNEIPIRPVWQLSDAEERRTKRVEVRYATPDVATTPSPPPVPRQNSPPRRPLTASDRLSKLLDRSSGISLLGLALIAVALGAAHAVQPGHGKTLVAATVLGERGGWLRGATLAVVTTLTHTGSVLIVAAGLWWTRSARFGEIHVGLAHVAGFVIAAVGLWRLGRHLAGYVAHDAHDFERTRWPGRGVLGLGVAGGLVPCWDAVGLIVLAEAVGRLALGVALLFAFGLGMASVLVLVGALAARLQGFLTRPEQEERWERRLGLFSGLVLSTIGVYFLVL